MHPILELLIKLQEIDKSIINITNEIDAVPKKIHIFQKPIKDALELLNKEKEKHQSLEKKKKQQEMDVEDAMDKLKKLRSKASEVKSNKEYQALLKEIETAEKSIRAKENDILDTMEILENLKKDIMEKEKAFQEADTIFKQQQELLNKEIEEKKTILKTLKQQRVDFIKNIDQETYKDYMHIMKVSGGIAVAETQREVCLGCNLHIPPQLYVEIMKGDEIFKCPYCRRILFSREEPKLANFASKREIDTDSDEE
ncbi:MAG: C4-type zinc ribbon domain-containing protein [Thermodesulfovibrionales bacterium]